MPKESAKTSLSQVAAGLKFLAGEVYVKNDVHTNLDYGGGAFDKGTEYLLEHLIINFVYDPFNRSERHNEAVRAFGHSRGFETVTCLNVLNVIPDLKERMTVIEDCLYFTNDKVIVGVYEGNKSDITKRTTKGYQLNRRLCDYEAEIKATFPHVYIEKRKGFLIIKEII